MYGKRRQGHPDGGDVVAAFRTVVASEEYTTEGVEYRHRTADGTGGDARFEFADASR